MSQAEQGRDEAAQPSVGEADLRLYLGPNPEPYVAFWDRARASIHPFVWSWNWWGFLFPVPWLFYRKLWAVGSAVVLLPALLDALSDFGSKAGIGLAALVAAGGKALVVERAERKVRSIDTLGLASQDSIDRLRRAGGVSTPGAVIGVLLMAALLGLTLYRHLPAQLPGCTDRTVRDTVTGIARDNAASTGLAGETLVLDGVRETGAAGAARRRVCQATLRSDDGHLPIEYEISWQSRRKGRYFVDLRLRKE